MTNKAIILSEKVMTNIADAIREKEGSSSLISPNEMANKIENLSGGSVDLEDVLNFAHELVSLDLGEVTSDPLEPEAFYLNNANYEAVENLIMYSSNINEIVPFRLTYNGREYIIVSYGYGSEETITDLTDIYADDITGEQHNTFLSLQLWDTTSENPRVRIYINDFNDDNGGLE